MQKLTNYDQQAKPEKWVMIDASNVRLGKLSTTISSLLMGKAEVDSVDYKPANIGIIVINSDKVSFHVTKARNKVYSRHSGFPGGYKSITLKEQMAKDSTKVILDSVSGMLPKNKLRAKMLSKLFVYRNADHKQEAQKPETIEVL